MSALPVVQMLWIEGALSVLERLSIASFLANGHEVHLYSYGMDGEVPSGAVVKDAAEILDPSARFVMQTNIGFGSVTPFANRFRYKLLYERGGVWSDADIVLLKPMTFLEGQEYWFCSEYGPPEAENKPPIAKVTNCFLKAPKGSVVMKECFDRAMSTDLASAEWAATGPKLLGDLVLAHKLTSSVLKPNAICPVAFWDISRLLSGMHTLPADAYAIHFYNEMFRRNFFDKNATYPSFCIYERLKAHYLGRPEP